MLDLGWELLLKDKYEPSTDKEALVNVQEKFATCKMATTREDPALWLDKLKTVNKRLAGID
jgi:hypothetical protein